MRRLLALLSVALLLAACSDGAGGPSGATTPELGGAATPGPTAAPAPTPTGTAAPEDSALPGSPEPPESPEPLESPAAPADGTQSATTPATPAPAAPGPVEIVATDIATGLEAPWDVAFTPDDRVFVTERDSGRLLELGPDGAVTEVQRLDVEPAGEGGLLGLAVSPDYADDGLLYAYLTGQEDNRIVRFRPGEDPEAILTGIPRSAIHNGGRIAFGPDGLLYAGTGDAGQESNAQDPGSLAGKILRVSPDGGVPGDNPLPGSPVYSLGHRNVQGLAWDAEGRLYATEFGPDRDDEINRIEPGSNYGWPEVTGAAGRAGFVDPILVRQPPEAAWSGATVPLDSAIPQWDGGLVVASLRGARLWHVPLTPDGAAGEPDDVLVDAYGRLRAAVSAPDGSVWVLTNNRDGRGQPAEGDDRIIRLGPPA
jgi:glucose/arabinose dehydrogenase